MHLARWEYATENFYTNSVFQEELCNSFYGRLQMEPCKTYLQGTFLLQTSFTSF